MNFHRVGSNARNCRPRDVTARSIILEWMPASHYPSGAITAGYIPMIRAAGFSGIAAITWAAESHTKTNAKSEDVKQCVGMSLRSSGIASLVTSLAGHVSDKRSYTGHMIAGSFEAIGQNIHLIVSCRASAASGQPSECGAVALGRGIRKRPQSAHSGSSCLCSWASGFAPKDGVSRRLRLSFG